jgi:hypothetical protein
VYCFHLFLVLLTSSHCCLDVLLFEKIQDYKKEDLEQQQAGSPGQIPLCPPFSHMACGDARFKLHIS